MRAIIKSKVVLEYITIISVNYDNSKTVIEFINHTYRNVAVDSLSNAYINCNAVGDKLIEITESFSVFE